MRKPRAHLQIFKVQRPVACTPGAEHTIYVYNQDRSVVFHGPVDVKTLCELFPKDEYKVFRYGSSSEKGGLKLDGEAPWQNW
jgi:hypothetical protein